MHFGQFASPRGYLGYALAHDRGLPQPRNVALKTRTVLVSSSKAGFSTGHPLHKSVRYRFMPRIAQRRVWETPAGRSFCGGIHCYQRISFLPYDLHLAAKHRSRPS